jgi:16S rRNA (adenine1518-N6/adenine1519-N6)-dimethyltransferase
VIAIEKVRRLAATLGERGAGSGEPLQVVHGDALRLDWHDLVHASKPTAPGFRLPAPFKIVGNIPYAITSPLLDKALTPPLPASIVFLVQAEVADRLAAPPGSKTYGALSVGVQAVCRVERLFTVRAGAFTPPPKVQSALVRLTPLAQPLVGPAELLAFRAFVTACFTRRRKQLRNVLVAATGRGAAQVSAGLATLGVDPATRPETLAPEVFVQLFRWGGSEG